MDITTDFSGLFTPPTDDLTFESLLEQVQELEEQVAMQSIDRLTSISSTDHFFAEVGRILKEYPTQKFVMWRFDIDKFQTVNNLFGVEEGNRLLVYCAKYLKRTMPNTRSSALGRLGGDVFCGLTPYHDHAMSSGDEGNHWHTASSTIGSMENFFKGFRDDFRFSISIGFYQIEDHNAPTEIMYSRALAASKACKDNSEKMYAFYDRALSAALEETQLITAEMHKALENGEFTVFLQPKVRLSDLSLVGAEALVRWLHPKKGRIPPDAFIPIFEENGFITKLDLYVLRRCCAYIQSWVRQGMTLIPLSVNLSQIDLSSPGLPSKIMAVLGEFNVDPKYIHLEITESAYAYDVEQVNGVTQAFKDLGFHLEMDDFGKGYSSLNMISELPIDTLKMDMVFLQGDYTGGSGKVISFVTGLARHMDLVTVAEGIETQEQLAFLRSINCDCGQGYLFSRPLPKADFDAYMRSCTISKFGANKVKHVDKTVSDYHGWHTQDIWELNSKFSKMFNAMPGGLGVCELNVLRNTFRLARYNSEFVTALHTTHDCLKFHCDNLIELVHLEDIGKIYEAMTVIHDPKEWSTDTGIKSMDLRMKILYSQEQVESDHNLPEYTWVRVKWSMVDFNAETRTYLVQVDDISDHYQALSDMEERMTQVDDLERQLQIYHNAGVASMATLFFESEEEEGKGKITYANPEFFTLYEKEYKEETILFPISMDFFFTEEFQKTLEEKFAAEIENQVDRFQWTLSHTNSEGTTQNTMTHGRIHRKEQGITIDILVKPVSELSSLEEKLAITEERHDALLKSTEISVMNYSTAIVDWAHDMQVSFGLPATEPINPNVIFPGYHIFNSDSVLRVEQALKELRMKEGCQTIECWLHHENYVDYALYRLTFYSTADDSGQITQISMVGRDITMETYGKGNVTLAEIAIHTPDGILVFAIDTGKLLFANDKFYSITGLNKEKMEQDFRNFPLRLINDEEHLPRSVLPELEEGEGVSFTRIAQLKNHSMRWIAMHGSHRGLYVYATVRDFTERKMLELQLEREMGFNEVLNYITDELLFRVNIQEKTVVFSGKSVKTFSLSPEPIHFSLSSTYLGMIEGEHEELFLEMVQDIVHGVEKPYEIKMKDSNEEINWYRFEYRIIREAGEPAFAVGKAVNINLQVDLMAKLERDPMTGCYNSSALKSHVNRILGETFPADVPLTKEGECAHALLLIDIINYNRLSAEVSHTNRDDMILQVSDVLDNRFRETDYVGKIAEDTFAVFMQNVSITTMVSQTIADIYEDFKHNNQMSSPELRLEINIRCSFASRDGLNYSTLLENARLIPMDP